MLLFCYITFSLRYFVENTTDAYTFVRTEVPRFELALLSVSSYFYAYQFTACYMYSKHGTLILKMQGPEEAQLRACNNELTYRRMVLFVQVTRKGGQLPSPLPSIRILVLRASLHQKQQNPSIMHEVASFLFGRDFDQPVSGHETRSA